MIFSFHLNLVLKEKFNEIHLPHCFCLSNSKNFLGERLEGLVLIRGTTKPAAVLVL